MALGNQYFNTYMYINLLREVFIILSLNKDLLEMYGTPCL